MGFSAGCGEGLRSVFKTSFTEKVPGRGSFPIDAGCGQQGAACLHGTGSRRSDVPDLQATLSFSQSRAPRKRGPQGDRSLAKHFLLVKRAAVHVRVSASRTRTAEAGKGNRFNPSVTCGYSGERRTASPWSASRTRHHRHRKNFQAESHKSLSWCLATSFRTFRGYSRSKLELSICSKKCHATPTEVELTRAQLGVRLVVQVKSKRRRLSKASIDGCTALLISGHPLPAAAPSGTELGPLFPLLAPSSHDQRTASQGFS